MAEFSKTKYNLKAKASFKTKFDIYLFDKAMNQTLNTISQDDFDIFKIDSPILNIYLTEYWQEKKGYELKAIKIEEIERKINEWRKDNETTIEQMRSKYINVTFLNKFPEKDFIELLNAKACDYCGITEEQIETLLKNRSLYKKNYRGRYLEIDRLNSNEEYSKKNCVMACYWCNNAKTDEFTQDEFKIIGKAIRDVFQSRLNKNLS